MTHQIPNIMRYKLPKKPLTGMNNTERRYCNNFLLPGVLSGDIIDWKYEAINFRLAVNTNYRPDFFVLKKAGECVEVHVIEVKGGYIRDDAMVKFKIAKELYSYFNWSMVQLKNNAWKVII